MSRTVSQDATWEEISAKSVARTICHFSIQLLSLPTGKMCLNNLFRKFVLIINL